MATTFTMTFTVTSKLHLGVISPARGVTPGDKLYILIVYEGALDVQSDEKFDFHVQSRRHDDGELSNGDVVACRLGSSPTVGDLFATFYWEGALTKRWC